MAAVSGPRGIGTKFVSGAILKGNEVSTAIFRGFLPSALAEDRYFAALQPCVAGHGLEHARNAFAVWLKGVSNRKAVVSVSPSEREA